MSRVRTRPFHRFPSISKNIMMSKQWFALGMLALLPLVATAQQDSSRELLQPGPLEASAPVRAPSYASAFKDYRAAADSQDAPDQAWRAANDEVGRLGGHAGHIRKNAESSPVAQVSSPAPARMMPMPVRPMGHGKHHH